MSHLIVSNYLREIEETIRYGGSNNEATIRGAFIGLINAYAKPRELRLIPEKDLTGTEGKRIIPDGTLKDALRLDHGHYEAKDTKDELDREIERKIAKGYPTVNILFEDSHTAVLIQNGRETMRTEISGDRANIDSLHHLLNAFVDFEPQVISNFRVAVRQFKVDLPQVLAALRTTIDREYAAAKNFKASLDDFLALCQASINPDIVFDDAREMLIQHILTEDIFYTVFNDTQFHRENNIAKELHKVEDTFFTGNTKRATLKKLETYYGAIRQSASGIANHHEKQHFLKAIYKDFYTVYNPKLADRLGVVYTPSEIVRFMLQSTEHLVHKHFGKLLSSKGVEILDPATGTGTFITDLIEHLKHNKKELEYKYKNEIHCNEVAILPYYIANLNIEFTYAQAMGTYAEFPHICFVDTLDNLGFKKRHVGAQDGFNFGISAENTDRVRRQNEKTISVVIGNPPYNANQMSENDNNKNRLYEGIDKRIRETYIHESTAQKTKLYDMYARFFRWASDRVSENGVIAFVTNRSFIASRTFDGFRKVVADEFNEIYLLDLGGDVRANPKLSGTTHNVFGIQTGVAISFLVRSKAKTGCQIFYARRPEMETAEEKMAFLSETGLADVEFERVIPDKNNNWINLTDNNFDEFLPIGNRETKAAKSQAHENAIFKLYSLGVATNRDEWVYDFDKASLEKKAKFLIATYNADVKRIGSKGISKEVVDDLDYDIKWTRAIKRDLANGIRYKFDETHIVVANYRPFVKAYLYRDAHLNEMSNLTTRFFGMGTIQNPSITIMGDSTGKPYFSLAIDRIPDLNFVSPASGGSQTFALFRYDELGNKVDNITDWALKQFGSYYAGSIRRLTKEQIFYYVYAVLHDPIYRDKYALNLVRDFPNIPFYADFAQWVKWGKSLVEMHIGFEHAKPYGLKRVNTKGVKNPKSKLRANKATGTVVLDDETILTNIPNVAWEYKLGNRSAMEWILDQYREAAPKDLKVREKFNIYRFADFKEHVIDLLRRTCTVSVETMEIIYAMKEIPR